MYPRLLIISPSAFNHLSGGGITFTNLFRGWPKDKIATAHSDRIPPTTDVCNHYYFLGRKEFPWMFPFSIANVQGREKLEQRLKAARDKTNINGFFSKIFGVLTKGGQCVFGDEIPTRAVLTNALKNWIREFKPEVIYTILGSLPYIRLVREIAEEFDLPVVIHMMDDWPTVSYERGFFGAHRRKKMDFELRSLINEAGACLGICDAMSKEFTKRYGRNFLSFHNALPGEEWLKKSRKDWRRKSPFIMVYAGALMPNSQLHSVKDAADAVAKLFESGLDIELRIYAPWYMARPHRAELERPGCVSVFDAPETMDIEKLFTGADLLLLPVNFDKASVTYVKYSMPTKIPAYMFSGIPTLAYGPKEVASIAYAKEYAWAHCVTSKNREALCDAIRMLAQDEELRKKLGAHAQKIAHERHDAAKVCAEFQAVIGKAANRKIW